MRPERARKPQLSARARTLTIAMTVVLAMIVFSWREVGFRGREDGGNGIESRVSRGVDVGGR